MRAVAPLKKHFFGLQIRFLVCKRRVTNQSKTILSIFMYVYEINNNAYKI